MEHCMPVIHRVRVDFNIPGHSYSTTKTKREENPPYENGVGTRALLLLCIQWQVPVPQDLQHAKLSPQSALPFVWILLQGSPRECYKSPVTHWTPSVMHMVWPPAWILQVWTPFHHQSDDLQNLSPRHPKPPTARSPMCLQPHPPQVKMTPSHGWLIPLLHPARITLPMPPSAGQHCPTGSQSNSFNKQGSRCQLVPKPPTARSPMCLQPHPPQVKMTPPHGWLIPLLHPARITLPMPPSAGQHCPTGSQSNSFNKQGSRCQLVPKPPTARSPMCLQPHPPQVKMTPPHGWLIPLLHPAIITLPMPPSAGQHCPTGSQSNSNKQGSRWQVFISTFIGWHSWLCCHLVSAV